MTYSERFTHKSGNRQQTSDKFPKTSVHKITDGCFPTNVLGLSPVHTVYQQQCPSNIVVSYKLNDSFDNVQCCFDKVERCFDNVACCFDNVVVLGNNVEAVRLCRKDEISTQNSFDIVAVFGNKVERCFDIVASVEGALCTVLWCFRCC